MSSFSAQIIDQRVIGITDTKREIFSRELNISNDQDKLRSTAFIFLVSQSVLGLSDDDIMDGIVDGGNDFGIDAIYYDEPTDGEISITVIQGKYRNSLNGNSNFPENGINGLIEAIRSLFDPNIPLNLNKRLSSRIEEIRSFVAAGAIPRVNAIATNNGLKWNSISEDRITSSKLHFGDQVSWKHIGPDELLSILQSQQKIDTQIQLSGHAIVEQFDFRRVLIGRMSVLELAKLVSQYGDRLLERNIRRYLGLSGNRVNEAVAGTLRDANQRSNFYFYNNGITIICSQFRHNALQQSGWPVQISGLQIVNGGQTSKTIYQILEEVGPEISSAQVLVRIYELPGDDDDLVSAITYATNSQNPVDLRDLKANDPIQKKLAESIKSLGYSYRPKREDKPVSSNDFTSSVVAESVLAIWRKRPHQARFSGGKHFGALYDKIFSDDLNGAQAIIAALILRQTENRRKRPPVDAPDFLAYGSRFIAMIIGRLLLSDLGIKLKELDHRNFSIARNKLDENINIYFKTAEGEIEKVLKPIFEQKERTLQRLSATFRRADIIEDLIQKELTALINE